MKIKVAIIGYGKVGKARFKILKKLQNLCEVSYIVDSTNFNIKNLKFSNNYYEVLKDKSIKAVFISTPNYLNYELTKKFLLNKKNVFCEKPPALNSQQMKEIIKAEKKTKMKLMYGFNHRSHTSVEYMKKIIDSGKFGNILWMRGRYGKSVNKDFLKSWRAKKKFSGGGILIDQGIHMLDLFIFFYGKFDKIKSSISNQYWKCDVEDNAFVILENSKTNVSASLHSTMTQWRHLFSLEIFMEHGYIVLNGLKTSSNSYGEEELNIVKNRTKAPSATWTDEEKLFYSIDDSWERELSIFRDAILEDRTIEHCGIDEAVQLMEMVDQVYAQ